MEKMNTNALLFAVDIGNTRTKFGVWFDLNDDVPASEFVDLSDTYEALVEWTSTLSMNARQTGRWIVSSVNSKKTDSLIRTIHDFRPNDSVEIVTLSDIPLNARYDYPEKLGIDRAVAAYAGLNLVGSNRPFLVVDVGTAATIDYVDSNGVFRGGAILPGPRLTAEALQRKTANLPMLDDPENTNLSLKINNSEGGILTYPATETNNAIRLGVVFTLVGAIAAFYWQTRRSIVNEGGDPCRLTLLLAGGDSLVTKTYLLGFFNDMEAALNRVVQRPEIVVESRLVLLGLKSLALMKNIFRRDK